MKHSPRMTCARLYLGDLDDPKAYLAMRPVAESKAIAPLLWLAMFANVDADAEGDLLSSTVVMALHRLEEREEFLRGVVRNIDGALQEFRAFLEASDCRFVTLDLAGVRARIGPKFFDSALAAFDDPRPLGVAAIMRCTGLLGVVDDQSLEARDRNGAIARHHLIGPALGTALPCEAHPLAAHEIPERKSSRESMPAFSPAAARRWLYLHAGMAWLLSPAFVALAIYEEGSRRLVAGLVAASCIFLGWALLRARSRAVWGYVLVGTTIIAYQFTRALAGAEIGPMHLAPGACVLMGYWSMREVLKSGE